MQLVLFILLACLIAPYLVSEQGVHGAFGGTFDKKIAPLTNNEKKNPLKGLPSEEEDEVVEDVDFDGDELEDEDFKGLLGIGSEDSLMHIRRVNGEVLVPCFGMWWPAGGYGGGGGGYEYVDYYGDYKKKRRRSRRQKKAAKTKRKKS